MGKKDQPYIAVACWSLVCVKVCQMEMGETTPINLKTCLSSSMK